MQAVAVPAGANQDPPALPLLREDLELREGGVSGDGQQSWLIYDALQHRYIQIDRPTFLLLSIWRKHRTRSSLIEAANQQHGSAISAAEFEKLVTFLRDHHLVSATTNLDWTKLARATRRRHGLFATLAHNYS